MTRRAGDVNALVTVRANAAKTASGTHQSVTGRLTSAAATVLRLLRTTLWETL
ncbi:MAG: hypothetical protein ACKO2L_17205 [Planctomycetaceae bacterium]